MALGSGITPWVECPYCGEVDLLVRACSKCGLSYGQARIKAGADLCLCGATRCEPKDGMPGWSTLHAPRETCPPNRGIPGHS